MKQMKIALVAILAILVGTTFTSCLNSDNEGSWDFYDYATLNAYNNTYVCENLGYVMTLTNGSSVFGTNYPERALIYFKLAEGEVLTEGKTAYQASVAASQPIYIKEFCNRVDTLGDSAFFTQIAEGGWSTSGPRAGHSYDYLNIQFTTNISTSTKMEFFNLIPEEVDGSTLYVRLHLDENVENIYSEATVFMNFKLPDVYGLQDMLGIEEFNKLSFFGNNNDSVNIVLRANRSADSVIEVKPIKAKIYGAY